MTSGKARVSCIPCARRKVRCDREHPCNHCKRRTRDRCEYPSSTSVLSSTRPVVAIDKHIQRLERYIRSLGADPTRAHDENATSAGEDVSSGSPPSAAAPSGSSTRSRHVPELSTPESTPQSNVGGTSRTPCSDTLPTRNATLIEHDEQVTYIETPMWYSWSGEGAGDAHPGSNVLRVINEPRTILDPFLPSNQASAPRTLPVNSNTLKELWAVFLRNVHPLLKMFFDWEIALLIDKACAGSGRLTVEEYTLVTAIIFISVVSLPADECNSLLNQDWSRAVEDLKMVVESALHVAGYITTTDRRVLQALMLYTIALNNHARPTAIFALFGIIERIALRMGIQRDGDALGLSVMRSEERRRMWWLLQLQEISVCRNLGSLSLTIYGDWDVKLPSNLEDDDFHPDLDHLPPPRPRLTSMSTCLCFYQILFMNRASDKLETRYKGVPWMLSPLVSMAEKEAVIDEMDDVLSTMFIRHCDPLDPHHLYIQLGLRQYTLAARRTIRQPALVNAKISEMSRQTRDEFLGMCVKSLEYLILMLTNELLRRFRWYSGFQFQMLSLVYIILEAHHRFDESNVTDLWAVLRKLYTSHHELSWNKGNRDYSFAARILLAAWQRRAVYLQARDPTTILEHPAWIRDVGRNFEVPLNLPAPSSSAAATTSFSAEEQASMATSPPGLGAIPPTSSTLTMTATTGENLVTDNAQGFGMPLDFDFDMLDWAAWDGFGGS